MVLSHGVFCPKAARGLNPLALAPKGSANFPEGCHGFISWRILPEGCDGIKSALVGARRLCQFTQRLPWFYLMAYFAQRPLVD